MQSFSKCPCCGDILLISYIDILGKSEKDLLRKQCYKIDHKFHCIYDSDETILFTIGLEIDPSNGLSTSWNFNTKKINIYNPRKNFNSPLYNAIPWFEPDFSDYKKLLNKLKTYVIYI